MFRALWFILATIFACQSAATMAAAALFERSHALVIGIDRYPDKAWPSLSYPVKDAKGMAAFLQTQGFEVTMLLDEEATRANIIDVINERLAPKLGDRDRVLVFFSGHGETKEIGGRDFGYVVPYDGGESISSWISMDQMREISRQLSKAHHQLFIFDSCYGGQFAVPRKGPLSSVSESHPRYIEKISANPARQYITAGGKGELVRANGPKGYSYFTGYLLEALEGAADLNGDTYVTSSELNAYLQPRASNWDHTPIAGVLPEHGQGNFWFRTPDVSNETAAADSIEIRPMSLSTLMKGAVDTTQRHPQYSKIQLDIIRVLHEHDITDSSLLLELPIDKAIDGIGPARRNALAENGIHNLQQVNKMSSQQERSLIDHKLFSSDGVSALKEKAEFFMGFATEYLPETAI